MVVSVAVGGGGGGGGGGDVCTPVWSGVVSPHCRLIMSMTNAVAGNGYIRC